MAFQDLGGLSSEIRRNLQNLPKFGHLCGDHQHSLFLLRSPQNTPAKVIDRDYANPCGTNLPRLGSFKIDFDYF